MFLISKKLKEFEQKAKPTLTGNGLKVSLKDFNDLKTCPCSRKEEYKNHERQRRFERIF